MPVLLDIVRIMKQKSLQYQGKWEHLIIDMSLVCTQTAHIKEFV